MPAGRPKKIITVEDLKTEPIEEIPSKDKEQPQEEQKPEEPKIERLNFSLSQRQFLVENFRDQLQEYILPDGKRLYKQFGSNLQAFFIDIVRFYLLYSPAIPFTIRKEPIPNSDKFNEYFIIQVNLEVPGIKYEFILQREFLRQNLESY